MCSIITPRLALPGDAALVAGRLAAALEALPQAKGKADWLREAAAQKAQWQALRASRVAGPALRDPVWPQPVMTQPQAIAAADVACRQVGRAEVL